MNKKKVLIILITILFSVASIEVIFLLNIKGSKSDIDDKTTNAVIPVKTSETSLTSTTVSVTTTETTTTSTSETTTTKTTTRTTTSKQTQSVNVVPVSPPVNDTPVETAPVQTNPVESTNEVKGITAEQEQNAYNIMIGFKEQYPTGMEYTNDVEYAWKGGIYNVGHGCAAFAFMLSDAVFGDAPAVKHTNFDDIKVGDIIRYLNDTHAVIVLKVKGDNFLIAEANVSVNGGPGQVLWGRTLTRNEIKSSGTFVLTRW